MNILSAIGLVISLALLIYLTMRGINIIIGAIISSVVVAVTSGLNLATAMMEDYMAGFTDYFASWFLVFLLGAIFGKVMDETKSADSIANGIKKTVGSKRAVFAVIAAAAIMTYGGVSLFVVGFAIYPIARSLFREANLPHRFIPAALVFGSISFTMTAPGSPEIQNIIPTEFFGTSPGAGGWIGVLSALLIMLAGSLWISRIVKKAVKAGETFSPPHALREDEQIPEGEHLEKEELPNVFIAVIPLIMVIVLLNVLSIYMEATAALLAALTIGIFLNCVMAYRFLSEFWEALAEGAQNSLVALANTCAVVGFGSVVGVIPIFDSIVDGVVGIPGPPLLGLAVGVTVVCGITGSASGGLGIALPILGPIYMGQGLDPGEMHRVSALASGGIDSLPHNGYVVTTIRVITGETHKRAYWPIFKLSVVVPTVVVILAVFLYYIF